MRYLSLCSGIEAATVAWRPLGWAACAFAEIEPFACAVLRHHYPDVPNLGDITRFHGWPDASFDVLVGGTPCQSFSVAGLRKGLDDPRGNLMLTLLAIARRYTPRWVVWENVPGVLSSDGGRDFGTFLAGLAELGYGFAYRVLDAQYFGLAQRRRRVFVVGCAGDWRAAAAVLFERDSLLGHPAPRRETGQDVAGTISARTRSGGGLGTDLECDGGLIPDVARALTSSNDRLDAESETFLVAHALRGEGFDASEDGTGRGTPLVPCAIQAGALRQNPRSGPDGVGLQVGIAYTLEARAEVQAVAFAQNQRNETRLMEVPGALAADPGAKQQSYVLAIRGRDDGRNLEVGNDNVANALVTPNGGRDGIGIGALMTPALQVRRLTPRECERLMGFRDDYTLIPLPLKTRQSRVRWSSDGARYRALGNSIAVPVLGWIGRRIAIVDDITAKVAQ